MSLIYVILSVILILILLLFCFILKNNQSKTLNEISSNTNPYTNLNLNSNVISGGFFTFYKYDECAKIVVDYLSNIYYICYLIQTSKVIKLKSNELTELILEIIYPTGRLNSDNEYFINICDVKTSELIEYKTYFNLLNKSISKFKKRDDKINSIINFCLNEGADYYLEQLKFQDKEKSKELIFKYYDITIPYIKKIIQYEVFDNLDETFNKKVDKLILSDKSTFNSYDSYKLVFTSLIELIMNIDIKTKYKILDIKEDDFFIISGSYNIVIPICLEIENKKTLKVLKIEYLSPTYLTYTEQFCQYLNHNDNTIFDLDKDKNILITPILNIPLIEIDINEYGELQDENIEKFQLYMKQKYNINLNSYNLIPAYGKVFEFIPHGDLLNLLHNYTEKHTNVVDLIVDMLFMYYKIIELYIRFIDVYHKNDYIYCDWKLSNLGLDNNKNVVIIDVDLIKTFDVLVQNDTYKITHFILDYGNNKRIPSVAKDDILKTSKSIFNRDIKNNCLINKTEYECLKNELENEMIYTSDSMKYREKYLFQLDNYIMFRDIILNLLIFVRTIFSLFSKNINKDLKSLYRKYKKEISNISIIENFNVDILLSIYDKFYSNDLNMSRFNDKDSKIVFNSLKEFIKTCINNLNYNKNSKVLIHDVNYNKNLNNVVEQILKTLYIDPKNKI